MKMTEGLQIRDFVEVGVVARALLDALELQVSKGQIHQENIGSGTPRSLRVFAEEWWSYWGATGSLLFGETPYRDNEVMRYVPAIQAK